MAESLYNQNSGPIVAVLLVCLILVIELGYRIGITHQASLSSSALIAPSGLAPSPTAHRSHAPNPVSPSARPPGN